MHYAAQYSRLGSSTETAALKVSAVVPAQMSLLKSVALLLPCVATTARQCVCDAPEGC
jgi:hypothetical protein